MLRESADGIRVAVRTPGLAALLLLVAGAAGFVIPVTSLLVPLITRQHHWSAATAGLIVGRRQPARSSSPWPWRAGEPQRGPGSRQRPTYSAPSRMRHPLRVRWSHVLRS
jgi:hypothetical protein